MCANAHGRRGRPFVRSFVAPSLQRAQKGVVAFVRNSQLDWSSPAVVLLPVFCTRR
jgi:hypothetical protein